MELDFLRKNCWYHRRRPLLANLHTLLKDSGPRRHFLQDAKLGNFIPRLRLKTVIKEGYA